MEGFASDLTRIVFAWPYLPQAIRRAMLALILDCSPDPR